MSINITEEKFLEFEKIRQEGKYNPLDPKARALSSLTKKEWVQIATDYNKFYKAWIKKEFNTDDK
tara:strand:+ start:606 stop:800 length:195 start_codon:yes stop_codon:yes gene_type:complete